MEEFQMKNIKKIICLILIFSLAFSGTQNVTAAKKHYSMKSVDWGLGLNGSYQESFIIKVKYYRCNYQ